MTPFDFEPRTRIVFGAEKIDTLGALAAELGARRPLVVSDPGVIACGHAERGMQALRSAGLDPVLFQGVHENPTTRDVEQGVQVARDIQPDMLIGLGGGSSMDCAKGMNFLYTNGGKMHDYWGVGKATRPMLPMIAVPTTSGTGSETQSFALISDAETHVKMACGDKKAACRIALLDPLLTVTQPPRVTALTGIDAISHALETYVTLKRNAASLAFSLESWRLLAGNFGAVLDNPSDLEARGAMQLGAAFAGLAIENSMLGAAHAMANPLTALYQTPHGHAVGVMLPHVVRFNGEQHPRWYAELLDLGGPALPAAESGAAGLADFLTGLIRKAGLATNLSQMSVTADRLPELAAAAEQQWTGKFNPRTAGVDDFLRLYQAAM
ncbi:iron-containing alcohol dehydrogenase [Lignipirellula cremea]|uniref:1,3-propanediol dehydrogenase n=1 Tax=Lignipirellula cremea TaxID=2528010 RepID=A0A518DQ90_9BACT|nr:iron-containing alcohol dehydrogenase [Lignipirellula cremea]QDU93992.1 1,3-propanediol dehydrogenase [Lignipirellula cremea]